MNLKQRRALEKQKKRQKKQLRIAQRLSHPTDANGYFNRGLVYAETGKYELALSDFTQAIVLNPRNAEAYNTRGSVYYRKKQYELALNDYNQAIILNLNSANAYNNRGNLYAEQNQYQAALSDLNQAIILDPNYANAYNGRGTIYAEQNQYQAALSDLNQAIILDPNCAAYNNRGNIYFKKKQYELALSDYNQAIDLDPKNANAYNGRGIVYCKKKQYELALSDLNQAIILDPNYANAYNGRGTIYAEQNQYKTALKNFNQAIVLDPEYAIAYYNRGLVYIQQQNYTAAEIDFNEAIKRSSLLEDKQLFCFTAYSAFLADQLFDKARIYADKLFNECGVLEQVHKTIYLDNIAKAEEIYQKNRKLETANRQLEKDYQAEVEESKRFKYLSSMATAVAHEINQPVGIIRAATGAALADIQDNLFQPTELEPLLNKIYAQTERLKNIIENFRKFAKGDRQHREKVNLNQVIAQTVAIFGAQFKHHNIELTVEVEIPPKPIVWANPFQLEEVLINLLNNAKDALEGLANPQIWITTEHLVTGETRIQVVDNGPGIAPEFAEKLFIPFESTKPTERGTGLGLHISRKIIEAFGGKINYIPRSSGGASFHITFPPLSESEELNHG